MVKPQIDRINPLRRTLDYDKIEQMATIYSAQQSLDAPLTMRKRRKPIADMLRMSQESARFEPENREMNRSESRNLIQQYAKSVDKHNEHLKSQTKIVCVTETPTPFYPAGHSPHNSPSRDKLIKRQKMIEKYNKQATIRRVVHPRHSINDL